MEKLKNLPLKWSVTLALLIATLFIAIFATAYKLPQMYKYEKKIWIKFLLAYQYLKIVKVLLIYLLLEKKEVLLKDVYQKSVKNLLLIMRF